MAVRERWIVLGRWAALCAVGVLGVAGGLVGGFHFSSYYWASVGPLQKDVVTCHTIVDVYEAVSGPDATAARNRISPHAYLCAVQLDQGYRYLDPTLQRAVAADLRQLAGLIARDEYMGAAVQRATLERLAKYAD